MRRQRYGSPLNFLLGQNGSCTIFYYLRLMTLAILLSFSLPFRSFYIWQFLLTTEK